MQNATNNMKWPRVSTKLRAGALSLNHNQAAGLRVISKLRGGALFDHHNQSAPELPARAKVRRPASA